MNPVFVVLHPTRNCRAEILDSVDNFAILCLDIVWCYLCLENISELPDAGMCCMLHCESLNVQIWKSSFTSGVFGSYMLMLSLDVFKTEVFQGMYWQGLRFQEVGDKGDYVWGMGACEGTESGIPEQLIK